MKVGEELAKLSNKIDQYHSEDAKRAKREWFEIRMYISWGFALATASLVSAQVSCISTIVSSVIAGSFVILGFVLFKLSIKYK